MPFAAAALMGLLLAAMPGARSLERIDSAAEDIYDHAARRAWPAAERDLARLHAACGRSKAAVCLDSRFPQAEQRLAAAVKARHPLEAMESANALTRLLAPQIDRTQGGVGIAPLDPEVRALELDARRRDFAAATRDLDTLRKGVAAVRCPRPALRAFDAPLARATQAATARDAAGLRRAATAMDEDVDRLERACLR